MRRETSLKFHARTFDLLGRTPVVSQEAVAEIRKIEERIGRRLPAAVREWYELEGACAILREYSNADPPVELADLGKPATTWVREDQRRYGLVADWPVDKIWEGPPRDLAAEGLLLIRYENQCICEWAVKLDASDDPPVLVTYDIDNLADWQALADRFSAYVYACVWDWGFALKAPLIQAKNGPVSEGALEALRARFREGPRTYGWPEYVEYRFESPNQRILIRSASNSAGWYLTAGDDAAFADLLAAVWTLDGLGGALRSNDEGGEVILARFRERMGQQKSP